MQDDGKRFGVRNFPSRPNASENSRRDSDYAGENQRGHIDARLFEARDVLRREAADRIETPDREADTGRRAREREQCAFGEKLTRERPATRPQRSADSEFLRTRQRAR